MNINTMIGHILVGLVWGAWHVPYYFGLLDKASLSSYTTQSLAVLILQAFLGTIAAAILYGEIRIRTDSVWPAMLLHTITNAIVLTLLLENLVEFKGGFDVLFSPGVESIMMVVLTAGMSVWLYNRRVKNT